MFAQRRFLSSFAAALIVSLFTAPIFAAVPDVLSQVPADSMLVIYVPKLSDANVKLAKYLKQIGVNVPQAADPLGAMLQDAGLKDGIDTDGSAAFVLPVLQLMGEPRMYFVLPIKDQAKFMGNFASSQPVPPAPNGQTYAGLLQVKTAQGPAGQTSYVKISGKYAIFGSHDTVVGKQAPASDPAALAANAGKLGATVMGDSDIVVYLNMGKAGPPFQPMVAMFFARAQMQMAQNPAAAQSMGGPEMAAAVFQMYGAAFSSLLTETQAIVIGGNFHDNAVSTRTAFQFRPDSTLAKIVSGSDGAAPMGLNRLPGGGPYIMACSINTKALDFQPMVAGLRDGIIAKLPADSPARGMLSLYADAFDMTSKVDQVSFVWYAPDAAKPESLMNMVCLYDAAKPAELRAEYLTLINHFSDEMKKMSEKTGGDGMQMKFTVEPNAVEVSGKKADRVQFSMTMPQPQPGQMQMMPMNPVMQMFAHPMTYLIADTDKSVVLSMGETAQMESAMKAASTSSGDFVKNEKLAALRKQLPADRFTEDYLDVGRYVDFFARMMMPAFTGQQVAAATPDLPPVAAAAATDHAGGLVITAIVPNDLVTGLQTYIKALQQPAPNAMNNAPLPPPAPEAAAPANAGAPMEIVTVHDADFDAKVVKAPYPTIVVFTAGYSMDGKRQENVFKDMLNTYGGDVGFIRVDTGTDNRTAEKLKLDALPTTVVFAGGQQVAKFSGFIAKDKLIEAISPFVK